MNRRNQILTGVLALQLALVALILWPRQAPAATGQALFPDLTADQIDSLNLTEAKGESLLLARSDDGWVLPDAGGYPAATGTVTTLLDKVVGLKAERLITQTSASHKRLKVADNDFNAKIEFGLSDGSKHRLYLGSSAGTGATHVRADDQEQVYMVSGLSINDATSRPASWIETVYFTVTQDAVVSLMLENANGRLEFAKDGGGAWTMSGLAAGETLDQDAVNSLVNGASWVSMLRPLGKERQADYGLDSPAAVLTLQTHSETEGDKSYTLQVGAQDAADQSYVLSASSSPYYVRVSSYTVSGWVEKGHEDFLVVPATATPTP